MGDSYTAPVPPGYELRLPTTSFKLFFVALVLFVFVPGLARIIFRLVVSRKLHLDDYFVLFAILCLAPAAAICHTIEDSIYLQIAVGLGWQKPPPNFLPDMLVFEQRILTASVLAWAALYSIKFAFLIFFRKLITRVDKLKTFWWVVVGLTAACGLVSIPLGFLVCSHLTPDYMSYCSIQQQLANEKGYLIATTTMDVVTDLLILVTPMIMLWPLQVSMLRKLALMGMMSLSAFMIAIAIVRCAGAPLPNGIIDSSWLIFWQGMEAAVAVLMVSLLVLKSMFTIESERRKSLQRRLDAEKGLSDQSSRSASSTARKSWRSSAGRSQKRSIDADRAPVHAWDPTESFALPQAHFKSPDSKALAHSYSSSKHREIQTEVIELPPTNPPQRCSSPRPGASTTTTFLGDRCLKSISPVVPNPLLRSKYYSHPSARSKDDDIESNGY